jgi:GrpB-like predicted nucleotidyltransferase (UPF0157 family)
MSKSVVEHDPAWADDFAVAAELIEQALGVTCVAVHHIGSTSIPDILAKPIIDILVEVTSLAQLDEVSPALCAIGFEAKGEYGFVARRYFRKTRDDGVRTHHIHIYAAGDDNLRRHIAFRDYMRAHPDIARDYSELKAKLIAGGNVDWSKYQASKGVFVEATERDALAWFVAR